MTPAQTTIRRLGQGGMVTMADALDHLTEADIVRGVLENELAIHEWGGEFRPEVLLRFDGRDYLSVSVRE